MNRAVVAPRLSGTPSPDDLPTGPQGVEDQRWRAWIEALLHLADCQIQSAGTERGAMATLSEQADGAPVWSIPELSRGVRTLEGLARMARHLPPADPPTLVAERAVEEHPMAIAAGGLPMSVDEVGCPEV